MTRDPDIVDYQWDRYCWRCPVCGEVLHTGTVAGMEFAVVAHELSKHAIKPGKGDWQ